MVKHLLLVFIGVVLLLVILAGCSRSGAPSGSFPKQAGSFTLVEGPILQPEDKDSSTPAHYASEYKLASGTSVSHDVVPYPSADEAKNEMARFKQFRQESLMQDETLTESGNKLVFSRGNGGVQTVTWVSNSWLCRTNSRDGNAAIQLADSLPYK
jgi:hypothetical protein